MPPSSLLVPPLVPPTTPSLSTIAPENFLKCRSHHVTPNSDSVVPRRKSSKFQTVARFGYSDLTALKHTSQRVPSCSPDTKLQPPSAGSAFLSSADYHLPRSVPPHFKRDSPSAVSLSRPVSWLFTAQNHLFCVLAGSHCHSAPHYGAGTRPCPPLEPRALLAVENTGGWGTSLVVQRSRLCFPVQGLQVPSLVGVQNKDPHMT